MMHLTDEAVLERAAEILQQRQDEVQREIRRLYRKYGRTEQTLEHALGKPKKLTMVEALLVAALTRTRYFVTAERPNGNRWHGDAECMYGARSMVIATMQPSRLELLWELWRSVSDQPVDNVALTEEHLRGSINRRDIRRLQEELRASNL